MTVTTTRRRESACRLLAGLVAMACFAAAAEMPGAIAKGAPEDSPKVVIDLVPEVSVVARGASFGILLRQKIAPGWHTYWRNPGDSGAPPELDWTLPTGVTISEFDWPWPERIPFGPLMNFGYHDEVLLPLTLTVPATFADDTLRVQVAGRILVCADICIPQQIQTSTLIPVGPGEPQLNPDVRDLFRQVRDRVPVRIDLPAKYSLYSIPGTLHPAAGAFDDKRISLSIGLPFVRGHRVSNVTYFPFLQDLVDNPDEQRYEINETGLVIDLKPGYLFDPVTADLSGVLVVEETMAAETAAGRAAAANNDQGKLVSAFEITVNPRSTGDAGSDAMSLPLAIAFAFLGGLILNLMPCVFPVLSVKILSLLDAVHRQGSSIMLHGLIYGAGVVLSFVGISALLIALRLSGEAAGWGFQLQSPLVVGVLAYLFVLVGLNLLGYFEIGGWMSLGAAGPAPGSERSDGYGASFSTGILATLIAAPCTAPFMGAAIGFALTQSPVVGVAVFASLGAGMASPYLVLCASPSLLRRLPRPGPWMVTFRHLLAFPMFASALWLLWVLGIQVGLDGMTQVLAGALTLTFAIWLLTQDVADRRVGVTVKLLAVLLLLVSAYLVSIQAGVAPDTTDRYSSVADDDACLVYSPTALAAVRETGDVLVNFTAAWCITCKVNELTALKTSRVQQALREHQITCMTADWTNEDPDITAALQEYGRSGVPLYLLYRQGEARAEVLPQILTPGILLAAIEAR